MPGNEQEALESYRSLLHLAANVAEGREFRGHITDRPLQTAATGAGAAGFTAAMLMTFLSPFVAAVGLPLAAGSLTGLAALSAVAVLATGGGEARLDGDFAELAAYYGGHPEEAPADWGKAAAELDRLGQALAAWDESARGSGERDRLIEAFDSAGRGLQQLLSDSYR